MIENMKDQETRQKWVDTILSTHDEAADLSGDIKSDLTHVINQSVLTFLRGFNNFEAFTEVLPEEEFMKQFLELHPEVSFQVVALAVHNTIDQMRKVFPIEIEDVSTEGISFEEFDEVLAEGSENMSFEDFGMEGAVSAVWKGTKATVKAVASDIAKLPGFRTVVKLSKVPHSMIGRITSYAQAKQIGLKALNEAVKSGYQRSIAACLRFLAAMKVNVGGLMRKLGLKSMGEKMYVSAAGTQGRANLRYTKAANHQLRKTGYKAEQEAFMKARESAIKKSKDEATKLKEADKAIRDQYRKDVMSQVDKAGGGKAWRDQLKDKAKKRMELVDKRVEEISKGFKS